MPLPLAPLHRFLVMVKFLQRTIYLLLKTLQAQSTPQDYERHMRMGVLKLDKVYEIDIVDPIDPIFIPEPSLTIVEETEIPNNK
jgi:hypothetical protein